MRCFTSDNAAPANPEILKALADCNIGHAPSYGDDAWTKSAESAVKSLFSRPCEVFFVVNGTGANLLALSPLCGRCGGILCARTAHINTDETAAPENVLGCKLLSVDTQDGKLNPDLLRPYLAEIGNFHHAQPQAVAIAQLTELGTVYTPREVKALADFCHENGLKLFMDGARLSTAAAALNLPIDDFTAKAGVDALVFGGTKNGLVFGEAVVSFDAELSKQYPYLRKNVGQLASKMRYVAAQFIPYIEDGLYIKNARAANAAAKRLRDRLIARGAEILWKSEANMIFFRLPQARFDELNAVVPFHMAGENIARLVTAFDTGDEEIEAFLAAYAR